MDLSSEERVGKCNTAFEGFLAALGPLRKLSKRQGLVGRRARELVEAMYQLQQ